MASGDGEDIFAPIRGTATRYFALLAGLFVFLLLVTSPLRDEPAIVLWCYAGLLGVFATAFRLHHRQPLAGALCSLGPFVLVTMLVWVRGGVGYPAGVTSYITLVAITGLCWNSQGAAVVAGLSSLVLGWFVMTGAPVPTSDKVQIWVELSIQLLIIAALVHFALRSLTKASLLALSHRERFRDVIASSPEAMIVLDRHGVVRMFNPAAVEMSGVAADDAIGRPFADIGWLTQDALQRSSDALAALGTARQAATVSFEVQRGRWLEASFALVGHPERESDRLLCVRDVTEREAAAKAREALDARIAQSKSIEALGRLAGGVAHDFNNMLTVISASVDLLKRRRHIDERESSLLDEVSAASSRAAALTSQLLSFGRKQVLQPRVMNPNGTIEHLEQLLRRLVRENIQLHIELDESLGCARLDESRLEQVIVNLVTNASDAMPDGGRLTIHTRNLQIDAGDVEHPDMPAGEYLQISVIDTGRGMTEETHARVFEPFFTTKPKGEGTGLGLATVQGIVAQSGGFISIKSSLGEGTQFDIYFPRTYERSSQPAGTPLHPSANARAGALNVLLVEDQAEVRRALRQMLEALGHSIQEASDGQDALERFGGNATSFELLVSDVIMPNLGGIDLAERLARTHPSLKVLLVSGYTEDAMTDGSRLGDNMQFLAKPFGRERLAEKLAMLMSAGA